MEDKEDLQVLGTRLGGEGGFVLSLAGITITPPFNPIEVVNVGLFGSLRISDHCFVVLWNGNLGSLDTFVVRCESCKWHRRVNRALYVQQRWDPYQVRLMTSRLELHGFTYSTQRNRWGCEP